MVNRRPRTTPGQRRGLRVGTGSTRQPTVPVRKRRISRAQREARRRRQLYVGAGIAGGLVLLILAVGLTNEYIIKPRTVLASVDGTAIRRSDYWRARGVDLINQVDQYSYAAGIVGGDQAAQYQQQAAVASSELDGLWGSTDVDEPFLRRMVEGQVYLNNLDELGLEVTDQDVETWQLGQFAPQDAPLVAPTATPTYIPTRAAWATETAQAAAAAQGSPAPVGAGTPSAPGASAPGAVIPPPAPPATVAAVSAASPTAEPASVAASPPLGSPAASATTAPTPNPEQARATAEAGFQSYRDDVFDRARISPEQYRRWVARPAVARQKVEAALQAQVGQSAPQVHARHILVGTEELAVALREQLAQGADFAQLARENSTDTGTAPNGGDLGWATRAEYVAPFAEAVFALKPGEVSQPVQTEFGWHIIRLEEVAEDRPMTDEQIEAAKTKVVEEWLAARIAETDIESGEVDLAPTEAPAAFEPPAAAPPATTAAPVAAPAGETPATRVPLPRPPSAG